MVVREDLSYSRMRVYDLAMKVNGIGEAKAIAVAQQFSSVGVLSKASVSEIAAVPGLGWAVIRQLKQLAVDRQRWNRYDRDI